MQSMNNRLSGIANKSLGRSKISDCRSLWNESADPAPQKEQSDSIPTKRNESADSDSTIRGIGFMNLQIRIYESPESDLLIPRHHESDSESLIRIHNLRRGFVSFWNERYIIWGHGCR
ncbi:hypothetical protein AVEN_5549-1 [Araneus ventricosus]|uniref:Uncharacterized protein n=1 Tax=Araneus ventricosus TaxID=182803 RepID=A0A4Y2DXU6_ARAVE|nr:hypothetical protein AVEN_5549-1 [Araneus ventricosus]